MKYHVMLQSGRELVLDLPNQDAESVAWEAHEEACLHDDYLVDVTPIYDA
mgnify:CR=1 FL=1